MTKLQKVLLAISLIFFASLSLFIFYQTFVKPDSPFVSNISAFSNVILAGLTLMYVYLTYLILISNNESLKEQNRPFVVVSFPYRNHRLDLEIENVGNRPAKNVTISCDPDISTMFTDESYRDLYKNMLNQKFMPPGFKANDMVGTSFDSMKKSKANREIEISIDYEDLKENKYSHRYEIHVHNYLYKGKVVTRDKRFQLEKMAKIFENVEKLLKRKLQ